MISQAMFLCTGNDFTGCVGSTTLIRGSCGKLWAEYVRVHWWFHTVRAVVVRLGQ